MSLFPWPRKNDLGGQPPRPPSFANRWLFEVPPACSRPLVAGAVCGPGLTGASPGLQLRQVAANLAQCTVVRLQVFGPCPSAGTPAGRFPHLSGRKVALPWWRPPARSGEPLAAHRRTAPRHGIRARWPPPGPPAQGAVRGVRKARIYPFTIPLRKSRKHYSVQARGLHARAFPRRAIPSVKLVGRGDTISRTKLKISSLLQTHPNPAGGWGPGWLSPSSRSCSLSRSHST